MFTLFEFIMVHLQVKIQNAVADGYIRIWTTSIFDSFYYLHRVASLKQLQQNVLFSLMIDCWPYPHSNASSHHATTRKPNKYLNSKHVHKQTTLMYMFNETRINTTVVTHTHTLQSNSHESWVMNHESHQYQPCECFILSIPQFWSESVTGI